MLKLNLILKKSGSLIFPNVRYTSLHKLSVLFVRINCFISTYIGYTMTALYFHHLIYKNFFQESIMK